MRFSIFLAATALSGSVAVAQDIRPPEAGIAAPEPVYSPYVGDHFPQNVYFSDTHIHTSWSTDSGLIGGTATPDDAYRVSRGEVIQSQIGGPVKLIRPLDFVVVADHAENLGLKDFIDRSDPKLLESEVGRRWHDMLKSGNSYDAFIELLEFDSEGVDPISNRDMTQASWQQVIENAERYNDPGVFTTFIGYEWPSQPKGNNLHRVVVFRDGAGRTSQIVPLTLFDSQDPEDLWA